MDSLKIKNNQQGFTIIELLVAIAIFGIAIVAATNLYFTSLKTKKRTESLYTVRQTGDYALSVMVNMIRNARSIESACNGESSSTITITNPDFGQTEFSCSGNQISSNSAALTPLPSDFSIQGCSSAFICNNNQQGQPPVITINFTLIKGTIAEPLGYASHNFKTTVSLRSYQD